MRKLITATILVSFLLFNCAPYVEATTESEVRGQISDINDQIKALDKQIASYQNQIAQTSEQKNSLAKIIKELTLTKSKLLTERTQIEKKITATGLVIKELSSTIVDHEDSISQSKKVISQMIFSLYQQEGETLAQKMLSGKTFEDMSREYNDVISTNNKLKDYIQELSIKKEELTNSKVEKLDEQDKLTALKKTLLQKEQAVGLTQQEKNKILTETKNKEAEYQKLLAEQLKRKDAFEKEIQDYEAQLKLLINPKFLPKEGSGALSWPLSYILITSPFGSRWGSFHYGVDFRASVGTSVLAMSAGEVIGTGDTDVACPKASFGKWIFIKYNNGLSSTYGHLSAISVKKGDKVKVGSIVGLSGNTGSSTGPHLHVSTYASDGVEVDSFESKSCTGKILTQPRITRADAHLNPLLYLPATTAKMFK